MLGIGDIFVLEPSYVWSLPMKIRALRFHDIHMYIYIYIYIYANMYMYIWCIYIYILIYLSISYWEVQLSKERPFSIPNDEQMNNRFGGWALSSSHSSFICVDLYIICIYTYIHQQTFLVLVLGGGNYITPKSNIYLVYKRYILPIGWLYATYHLIQEPETSVEYMYLETLT